MPSKYAKERLLNEISRLQLQDELKDWFFIHVVNLKNLQYDDVVQKM